MEFIKKYFKFIGLFLIFIIILIVAFVFNDTDVSNIEEEDNIEIVDEVSVPEVKSSKIKVDVKGEVLNPGVYELDENTRVVDAIKASGGLTKSADTSLINLSKTLTNEMVIIIYNKDKIEKLREDSKDVKVIYEYIEKECSCPDTINDACVSDYKENNDKKEENKDTRVNINKATIEELQTIPGIGESKAKAILEYRSKTPFEKIEDIMNISGIGTSTFEKLKNYITV